MTPPQKPNQFLAIAQQAEKTANRLKESARQQQQGDTPHPKKNRRNRQQGDFTFNLDQKIGGFN